MSHFKSVQCPSFLFHNVFILDPRYQGRKRLHIQYWMESYTCVVCVCACVWEEKVRWWHMTLFMFINLFIFWLFEMMAHDSCTWLFQKWLFCGRDTELFCGKEYEFHDAALSCSSLVVTPYHGNRALSIGLFCERDTGLFCGRGYEFQVAALSCSSLVVTQHHRNRAPSRELFQQGLFCGRDTGLLCGRGYEFQSLPFYAVVWLSLHIMEIGLFQ